MKPSHKNIGIMKIILLNGGRCRDCGEVFSDFSSMVELFFAGAKTNMKSSAK